ncbi:nucleoside hydrolase [Jannaschia sp. Os4]|uniref:nucleoside hydrolase n=1 Tax=Jannaschia sp. Os4 TaxID=2807617 RepID=UPI00193ADA59|nr:nucleoside hydrolase [Jannaschia sp. Os4]MBM2578115.1 nucleoside hydrolase [Jannaschia sp. Os4]
MTDRILIDTDPGVDDAMAIAMAAADPRLSLVGLSTVFGNVRAATATRNALVLCDWLGLDVPVAEGADVSQALGRFDAVDWVHGAEGFGDMPAQAPSRGKDPRDAADLIIEASKAGLLVLAPIGPLTNVAEAMQRDPGLAARLDHLVIMGGSLSGGNVTARAEANVWHDPHAAREVLRAGANVTLVGLDVTNRVCCTADDFDRLAREAPAMGGRLREMGAFYLDFYASKGMAGCGLHDPAAILAHTDPDLFAFEETGIDVILDGDAVGETVRADGPPVRVAVDGDLDAIKERFLGLVGRLD